MNYRTKPLIHYLDNAAAAQPTPGGGSVAAVAGALASTMASMAAGFTKGKEKFKDVQPEIEEALGRLAETRNRLLGLADEDMVAYESVMAAYRMPKGTDEEKSARAEAVRQATKHRSAWSSRSWPPAATSWSSACAWRGSRIRTLSATWASPGNSRRAPQGLLFSTWKSTSRATRTRPTRRPCASE